jgi:hypothetical protein
MDHKFKIRETKSCYFALMSSVESSVDLTTTFFLNITLPTQIQSFERYLTPVVGGNDGASCFLLPVYHRIPLQKTP